MRSKIGMMLFVCFCIFVVSTGPTLAADSYVWTGVEGGYFSIVNNGLASGYSVDMFSLSDPNEKITLFGTGSGNTSNTSWSFYIEGGDAYGEYRIKRTTNEEDILLGSSLNFGFKIYNDSGSVVSYVLPSLSPVGNTWSLVYGSGSPTISITNEGGIKSVSAVPIPGAAVLLGSGLLGLVGIGSRKKKSIVPVAA